MYLREHFQKSYKIALVNLPFADLRMPAFGITQLKAVLEQRFGTQVSVSVLYLNQDFAHYLGLEMYKHVLDELGAANSGFGDWLFRQIAFPRVDDNHDAYFARFFPGNADEVKSFRSWALEKRHGLEAFMTGLVEHYGLADMDVVGFTSMFSQNGASFAMARKVKQHNPRIVTVMGGANCEHPMGEEIAAHVEQIDYVFSGSALKSFPEFVRYRLDGDLDRCTRIPGVFSRHGGSTGEAPIHPPIGEELDINIPIPLDYGPFLETLQSNFPQGEIKPILLFETSRGCWWGERAHCTFCGLNGATMGYRAMQPELAIELIQGLFRYADRCSDFHSVDNILPVSYLKQVLPHLVPPEHVRLFYEVKANLKPEEIEALARARVTMIQPGIESLASSTLKLMQKGSTVFTNLMLLKSCAMFGVLPAWNLLVGFPGEGESVYQKYDRDLPLLVHLPPPAGVYPVRFDRYSPYFVRANEYKLELRPYDFYRMVYPFGEAALANLAYYFMDQNYRADYFTAMVRWIGRLQKHVAAWGKLWADGGAMEVPRLCFQDATNVFDSRFGRGSEHEVGEVGRQVLELLEQPRKAADLQQRLGHLPGFDAVREIEKLGAKGLIFREGDLSLSLVFDREPARVSDYFRFEA